MASKAKIFSNRLRYTDRYYSWRDTVVKEQGRRCQLCGATKRVHVHHIKYFQTIVREFLSRYDNLDIFQDCDELIDCSEYHEELWEPENGLVLCEECHALEHNMLEEDIYANSKNR